MSRLIYLLRHGQTRFNAEQRLQGRCNSELTDKGEAQAIAMGRRLAGELADPARWTVYASPLGRARQTAQLVCEQLGLAADRIVWDDRLMELGMGGVGELPDPGTAACPSRTRYRQGGLVSAGSGGRVLREHSAPGTPVVAGPSHRRAGHRYLPRSARCHVARRLCRSRL